MRINSIYGVNNNSKPSFGAFKNHAARQELKKHLKPYETDYVLAQGDAVQGLLLFIGEQNKLYLGLNDKYFKYRPKSEMQTAKEDLHIAFNEGWAKGGKVPEPDGSYLLETDEDYICCRTALGYQMRNEFPTGDSPKPSSDTKDAEPSEDNYKKWWDRAHEWV